MRIKASDIKKISKYRIGGELYYNFEFVGEQAGDNQTAMKLVKNPRGVGFCMGSGFLDEVIHEFNLIKEGRATVCRMLENHQIMEYDGR